MEIIDACDNFRYAEIIKIYVGVNGESQCFLSSHLFSSVPDYNLAPIPPTLSHSLHLAPSALPVVMCNELNAPHRSVGSNSLILSCETELNAPHHSACSNSLRLSCVPS